MNFNFNKVVAGLALTMACGMASAATVYVGSWEVDQGPSWQTAPTAYTGQEAAALLFGGTAADYVISTVSNAVATIDDLAWVSIYGVSGGSKIADDAKTASAAGTYLTTYDTSAYITDNATGADYTNYAFRVSSVSAVPEADTYAMVLAGLGLLAFMARRKSRQA